MYSTHEGYNDSIHGYYLEDLKIGMSASHAKTGTETDVVMFAGLTGDNNPVPGTPAGDHEHDLHRAGQGGGGG